MILVVCLALGLKKQRRLPKKIGTGFRLVCCGRTTGDRRAVLALYYPKRQEDG